MNKTKSKHLNFQLKDLAISVELMEELARIDDSMPDYSKFLENEIVNSLSPSKIEGGYVIMPAQVNKNTVVVGNNTFEVGESIAKKYTNSTHIAIFTCTAGKLVSKRIQELNSQGLILEAYLVDLLGSVMVEKAMDNLQSILEDECALEKQNISNRYSPGYMDWNVMEQRMLFDLLPDNFCGIQLSESCLMTPVKSISGFIGIGEKVRFQKHACHFCNSTNCIYRNSKKHC
ncbi:vitamin B12 dependent-methionine synthase activation domain-containing protein [Marinifilum sp. RC60d5]|uniref:vitamin B12 dependent-methionine synthase activation domain-containing protein n=1 Tax=Marinifilum sp. RC60d5 TaxID=3458414 RepID=UPI0040374AA9